MAIVFGGIFMLGTGGTKFDDAVGAFEARNFEQSIELFTDIIEAGDLQGEKLAQAYAYRGHAQYFGGSNEAAVEDYSTALELNSGDGQLRYALVAALVAAGNYARALVEADRAVEQNPSDGVAYGNRCDLRRILKEYEAALVDCNQAVELNPGFAFSWMERAKLYRDWGYHDKARTDAQAAYELWPLHPAIQEMAKQYGLIAG
jgi:tetratricopeptide (TPR) repeat protein